MEPGIVDPNSSTSAPILTSLGMVYPWQCDHMGHMNVMWYTNKFDEASWQLLGRLGLTPSWLQERGTGVAAVEQYIQYKRELHAGNLITVRSRLLEVKEKSIQLTHEMRNDETEELVATCVIVGVHFDRATRKACHLPPFLSSPLLRGGEQT